MNTSAFEKEFGSLGTSYSQYDQQRQTINTSNPNQQSTSNLENPNRELSSLYGRGSLRNLSNDELEKLIQTKNQSIEKLRTPNTYISSSPIPAVSSIPGSGVKTANSKLGDILSKYDLGSAIDKKSSDPNFLNNNSVIGMTNYLPTGYMNPALDRQNRRIETIQTKGQSIDQDSLRENLFTMNANENQYMLDPTNRNNPKHSESVSYNREYETHREDQTSYVYESSPLLVAQSARPHSREHNKSTSRVLLTPKQSGLPKSQRNDGGSPAVAGAMKALQERLTRAELENEELRRKVGDVATEKQREMEEQRRKMYKELEERESRENELRKVVEGLKDKNFEFENEITRLRLGSQTMEEQLKVVKAEASKLKEDFKTVQQENNIMNKEIMLVENEKNYHLEQNANDKDTFEKKIEELVAQLEEESEAHDRLKRQKEELEVKKDQLEQKLHQVSVETARVDKQNIDTIKHLEHELDKASRQNQAYFEEFSVTSERYEREKVALQKKVTDFDKRVDAIVVSYEEKLEAFREENKDLKKSSTAHNTEFVALKKKVTQLEKENLKLENDRDEKERVIRQLMEMNDDLIRKMKKDPNNTALQNIILRKKKIEQDLQSKQNTAKKGTSSGRKKAFSRSRSPSVRKKSKNLSVEDLNVTQDEHKPEASLSSSKGKKYTTGRAKRQASPYQANKISPRRNLHEVTQKYDSGRSLSRKDSAIETYREEQVSTRNIPRSLATYSSEDPHSGYNFTRNLGVPGTTSTETGRRYLSNTSKDYGLGQQTHAEPISITGGHGVKLGSHWDKMSSNEISAEIVRTEREVAELKREYKNLLSKAQDNTLENRQEIKNRLSQVADELSEKSEIHLLMKKKQREVLAKNL